MTALTASHGVPRLAAQLSEARREGPLQAPHEHGLGYTFILVLWNSETISWYFYATQVVVL